MDDPPEPARARSRRPRSTIYRYLTREMVFPTALSLGGLTVVVLTKNLLGYSELVINRGLGLPAVGWIALCQALPLATRVLPFAVLVGCGTALGRLGADRELLALEACGLSPRRLAGPALLFGGVAGAVALGLSLGAAPWASRSLDAALERLAREQPAAVVRAGSVQEVGPWKLYARHVSADGRDLREVALRLPRLGETVFAAQGRLERGEAGRAELLLWRGTALVSPGHVPRQLAFESLRAELPGGAQEPIEAEGHDPADGTPSLELWRRARDPALPAEVRREAGVRLQRRLALPLAAPLLGLLVVPLVLRSGGRGTPSRAGGAALGVAATVAYYGLVQLGNGLTRGGTLGVAAGIWLPNAVAAGAAVLGLWSAGGSTAERGDGGQLAARLRALLRRPALRAAGRPRRAPGGGRAASAPPAGELRTHRRALDRYVARRFLALAGAVFAALVTAYLMVDVLERLSWFARYEATPAEAVRFYGARIPLLASRVVPMALMVATSLTVGLLAVQGELTGIRACGIPSLRAVMPLLGCCALAVPLSFLLNDEVVPRTNALADHLKVTEIKDRRAARADAGKPVWFRAGDRWVEADALDPQLGTAHGLTLYRLGPDGLPTRRTDARSARHFGDGRWRLASPSALRLGAEGARSAPSPSVVELGAGVPAEVDTMHFSVGELRREIRQVREEGYDPAVYEVDLHAKLAAPVACLVLPALALLFAVSGPPHPRPALSLVVSAVAAVTYVLASGVSASLGYGGVLPPWLAGWAPTAAFALAAAWLAWRLRGFGSGAR